jgi:hypothetical protein
MGSQSVVQRAHKITTAPCCCPLQANYNNCSEVDLESVDDYKVGADDGVDTDRAASPKRLREVPSSADTTAELTLDNASSSIPSSGTAATPAAPAVATLMEALNKATHSISTVVERLADVAEQQREAAERLAAMHSPSQHNQQQQQGLVTPPQVMQPQPQMHWRGQVALQQHMLWQQQQHMLWQQQQHMLWQQQRFHVHQQQQRQLQWQQPQQQQQQLTNCWFQK